MNAKHVRTVELQLLRHGPPHNQLLSPLTDYLALCGDHPNTTLNFPLEHLSLVVRLRALRYQDSEETRKTQLHETAQMVAKMFASVPGLISELGRRDSKSESLAHLSIATTASELSLVPFELATSPPGFPGSGASFCLQTEFPVCITRRSRQVRFRELQWDTEVRILLVASDPMQLGLPLLDHVSVLREIVKPWIYRAHMDALIEVKETREIDSAIKEDASPRSRKLNRKLEQIGQLTILLSATAEGISRTIRQAIMDQKPYSHIHILAHGSEIPNQPESSGLALHTERQGETDVVDGLRLGQLLTANRTGREANENAPPSQEQGFHPLVVTVAVCDSGRTPTDMAKPGSSVGFHIHEARIPFVVCSQFPLTKQGSVIFTEAFYSRLLDGIDPRICLWEARREVFSQQSERKTSVDSRDVPSNRARGRHDWASIIAFASLPPSIEQQTLQFERSQRQKRMKSKLDAGDQSWPPSADPTDDYVREDFVELAQNEVVKFDDFVDHRFFDSQDHTNLLGISASANKRVAEFLYAYYTMKGGDENDRWLMHIRQSYKRYLLISRRDANCRWAFVQRLFLKWFLTLYQISSEQNPEKLALFTGKHEDLRKEWIKTAFLCQESADGLNSCEQIWHLTDKLELGLLCWLIFPTDNPTTVENIWDLNVMRQNLQTLDRLALAGSDQERFAAYSGQRQLLRYRRFANMFYSQERSVENNRTSKSRSHKKWGAGYGALKQNFGGFSEVFEEVERIVLAQMEMNV